jgi:hypothetical protein
MNEQLKQMIYTVLRVFFATTLALIVADLANLMDFHWADWKPVIIAGIAAVMGVIIVALNPKDVRYGIGAAKSA